MKLIKQSKLFFKEGKSDKVYEIDLCELSPDAYLVNFRYGRRGASLKEGTKTPSAVVKDEAEKLFSALENEKRKKGYQTENEVFVELPSLDEVKPDSIQGVIMHRLQDAIEGKNSFKTTWKTSRVIWKAASLGMQEAVPYILKLASKGDELQAYSAIYALLKLKAATAEELFRSYAFMAKQKQYISNIANEALLTILEGEKLDVHIQFLLEKIPANVRYAVDTDNLKALKISLEEYTLQAKLDFITDYYLAYKHKHEVIAVLLDVMKKWELRPPFFKHIRAIYKLSQVRGDMQTAAILAYRFETTNAMFNRTQGLDSEYGWQYITSLNESFVVGKELRKKDSKIAYSQFTRKYLQRNSLDFIEKIGELGDAKEYLRLAIPTLLQYTDADYSAPGEKLVNNYGSYDWGTRDYRYLMINYTECSRALMLSYILFGNEDNRILDKNMSFIYGKRYLKSRNYRYKENEVTEIKRIGICGAPPPKREIAPPKSPNSSSSIFGSIKNIFGKKEEKKTLLDARGSSDTEIVHEQKQHSASVRIELHPEHWDAMPESYIVLLMKSPMNLVQKFAYQNLVQHSKYNELTTKISSSDLLMLFNTAYEYPGMLAMDVLMQRSDEFIADKIFVASLLASKNKDAREWAQKIIDKSLGFYTEDIDFVFNIIFNSYTDCGVWINKILTQTSFTNDRIKALLGKSVMELLQKENTPENNKLAELVISRLNVLAAEYLDQISWDVVGNLMSSVLESNIIFAGDIIVKKALKTSPTEVPTDLVKMFLENNIPGVRNNGMALFDKYTDSFLKQNKEFLFALANTIYNDVLDNVLNRIKQIVATDNSFGSEAIYYLTYVLIRKEKFEGAHAAVRNFVTTDLRKNWSDLNTKSIITLIYANYRDSQLTGYEILKNYSNPNDFTVGQIVSLGNHEILAIRQWCWKYFKDNVPRIRFERDKALIMLDSKWDDTRTFAFNFFKTEFTEADWDVDTLIAITDSVRADVEKFGKELITLHFKPDNALEYLVKLSEHPSPAIQMFVSSYLSHYAADNLDKLKELDYYFRSTLTRVNKGRVAKGRIFEFLQTEALRNNESAHFIGRIMDDLSAQTTVQDKATCIDILTAIKNRYPELKMHLKILES